MTRIVEMDLTAVFHDVVQPATALLRDVLHVPALLAPTLALCLGFFVPVYFAAALLLHSAGYRGRHLWELASAVPSFAHGCVTAVMAPILVARHMEADGGFDAGANNTAADVSLLQFSCAYFLHDLFVYIGIFARHEALFAVHHVVVTTYMSICLHYLGFSAITSIVAVAMGEVTSPLQNSWFWFKTWRYDSQFADDVFRHLSLVYAIVYVVCRSIVGPVVIGADAYAVIHCERLQPAIRGLFVFFLVGGVAGSQGWSMRVARRILQPYRPAYGRSKSLNDIDDISAAVLGDVHDKKAT